MAELRSAKMTRLNRKASNKPKLWFGVVEFGLVWMSLVWCGWFWYGLDEFGLENKLIFVWFGRWTLNNSESSSSAIQLSLRACSFASSWRQCLMGFRSTACCGSGLCCWPRWRGCSWPGAPPPSPRAGAGSSSSAARQDFSQQWVSLLSCIPRPKL